MERQLIPSSELVNPKQGTLLPHLLMLPVQVLCLSLPPFFGRPLLLLPIITVIAYATYTNHPGDSVADRAMAGVHWTVFVGTMERLIFTLPERDFWRNTRGPSDAQSLRPLSFAKFRWALSLCLNMRGVGWNFQVRGISAAKVAHGKWEFIGSQLLKYLRCYIISDLVCLYFTRFHHEPGTPLHELTLYSDSYVRFFLNCFLAGCKNYFPIQMNYTLASILGVLSGLTGPKDWPVLFGDISKVTTIRYFWGSYWQQLLRRMFIGWGEGLARLLHLPSRGRMTGYFKLYVAFAISGFFHAAMTYTMPATKQHTFHDRFGIVVTGFMLQAVGINFEDIIMWAYGKVFGKDTVGSQSGMWRKLLGWSWVMGWMWFSIYWAAEGYLRSGITLTNDVPVPVIEKVLQALVDNTEGGSILPSLGLWKM